MGRLSPQVGACPEAELLLRLGAGIKGAVLSQKTRMGLVHLAAGKFDSGFLRFFHGIEMFKTGVDRAGERVPHGGFEIGFFEGFLFHGDIIRATGWMGLCM
jgi:hypothetical protein